MPPKPDNEKDYEGGVLNEATVAAKQPKRKSLVTANLMNQIKAYKNNIIRNEHGKVSIDYMLWHGITKQLKNHGFTRELEEVYEWVMDPTLTDKELQGRRLMYSASIKGNNAANKYGGFSDARWLKEMTPTINELHGRGYTDEADEVYKRHYDTNRSEASSEVLSKMAGTVGKVFELSSLFSATSLSELAKNLFFTKPTWAGVARGATIELTKQSLDGEIDFIPLIAEPLPFFWNKSFQLTAANIERTAKTNSVKGKNGKLSIPSGTKPTMQSSGSLGNGLGFGVDTSLSSVSIPKFSYSGVADTLSMPDNDTLSAIRSDSSTNTKNISIHIDKLVENISYTGDMGREGSIADFASKLKEVLINVVNEASIAIE